MQINQARISDSIGFFRDKFLLKNNFANYKDRSAPAFFFGCYTGTDMRFVLDHEEIAVIIWAGSDMLKFLNHRMDTTVLFKENVRHVAISNFISDDLSYLGIDHYRIPISPTKEENFKLSKNGKCVYCYVSEGNPETYNTELVKEIARDTKDVNFIICNSGRFDYRNMNTVYAQSFLSLRLTKHDGLANTAIESGLCGKRVVWNGNTPNAIPWTDKKDVIDIIRREKSEIGKKNETIRKEMLDFLNIGNDWKFTKYYNKDNAKC